MLELLKNLSYEDIPAYGGKAGMLSLMISNGISVPEGIAIGADEFIGVINSKAIKDSVFKFWNPISPNAMIDEARGIKGFIRELDITPLVNDVKILLASISLGSVKLIFRSSATSEDGRVFSFAGQFMSEPGDVNDVEKRIKEIWCSVFEQNVNLYLRGANKEHLSVNCLGMGVVIQRFVDFDVSGILFSKHPTIDIKNWLLIEYAEGALQKIVHGEIIPSRARINIATNQVLYESNDAILLCNEYIDDIVNFTNCLRTTIKCEVDIEWGIANDKVVFVQCRPITTLIQSECEVLSANG
jgi:pyruvate,water dikinase